MDPSNINFDIDTLREQTMAALESRCLDAPETVSDPRRHQPRAGELYFIDRSNESGVEWLLIDDQPDPEGRFATLAVDSFPMVGSRDISLYPGDPLRIANVRCDLQARVESSLLDPAARSGQLAEAHLFAIRKRRKDIATASLEPSMVDQIADSDPEYWCWRRDIRASIARLEDLVKPAATMPLEEASAPDVHPSILSRPATDLQHQRAPGLFAKLRVRKPSGAAAALALAAGLLLAIGGLSLWRLSVLQRSLTNERQLNAALNQEKLAIEEQLASEIEVLEARLAEQERLASTAGRELTLEIETLRNQLAERRRLAEQLATVRDAQQQQIARLEVRIQDLEADPLPRGTVIVDLGSGPIASRRGLVRISQGQRSIALLLEVLTGTPYDRYRIEISHKRTKKSVLTTEELAWFGSKLGVVISTEGLEEDGDYDIQLFGIEEGVAIPLGERYELTLVRW